MSNEVQVRSFPHEEVLATLKEMVFFKDFPEHLLSTLAHLVESKEFVSGEKILEQGESNTYLYFLTFGKLSVMVDGGVVARYLNQGDVFGEMSIISDSPCSATVIADSPSTVFRVQVQDFETLPGVTFSEIQVILLRVYSMTLAQKLKMTNQKAKHFEEIILQLQEAKEELLDVNNQLEERIKRRTVDLENKTKDLEQKNTALVMSLKKIEELYSNREVAFDRLNNLYKNHLLPLKATLGHLDIDSEQALVVKSEQEVASIVQVLKPIAESYSIEKAMKSKRVLLAEIDHEQQTMVRMALGGTGVKLQECSSRDDLEAMLLEHSVDVLFVSLEFLDLVPKIKRAYPLLHIVFMTTCKITKYLPLLKNLDTLPHLVSRDVQDRIFTIENIMTTVSKLISKDIFGIDKYLSWGVDIQHIKVNSSEARSDYIDQVIQYFGRLGMRKDNLKRCATVLDELLMNAIYGIPRDKNGKETFNHLDRQTPITSDQEATLSFACDGMLMAVSVSAPFGGLKVRTLLNYIDSCYGGDAGKFNTKKNEKECTGFHQILEQSDLVVFNVYENQRTEVIALFNVDLKRMGDKHPSLHYFIME